MIKVTQEPELRPKIGPDRQRLNMERGGGQLRGKPLGEFWGPFWGPFLGEFWGQY